MRGEDLGGGAGDHCRRQRLCPSDATKGVDVLDHLAPGHSQRVSTVALQRPTTHPPQRRERSGARRVTGLVLEELVVPSNEGRPQLLVQDPQRDRAEADAGSTGSRRTTRASSTTCPEANPAPCQWLGRRTAQQLDQQLVRRGPLLIRWHKSPTNLPDCVGDRPVLKAHRAPFLSAAAVATCLEVWPLAA